MYCRRHIIYILQLVIYLVRFQPCFLWWESYSEGQRSRLYSFKSEVPGKTIKTQLSGWFKWVGCSFSKVTGDAETSSFNESFPLDWLWDSHDRSDLLERAYLAPIANETVRDPKATTPHPTKKGPGSWTRFEPIPQLRLAVKLRRSSHYAI